MTNEDYTINIDNLTDFRQTIEEIIRLSTSYWTDLLQPNQYKINFKKINFPQYFDLIQKIEYKADPKGIEFLSRPKHLLNRKGIYFDCDDRSILSVSFIFLKNYLLSKNILSPIQARVDATGRYYKPHHVFVSFKIPLITNWITLDPTYPKNEYGKELFGAGYRYTKIIS